MRVKKKSDKTKKIEKKSHMLNKRIEMPEKCKQDEREKDLLIKKRLRDNKEYREIEKKKDLVNKHKLRQDKLYKEKENVANKSKMEELRQDELYKEKEKAANKSNMEKLRQDELYKEKEKAANKSNMEKLRQDEQYRERQNAVNKSNMQKLREDALYRKKEGEKDIANKHKLRQDESYKEKEKATNKSNMEKLRQDELYKEKEKAANKSNMEKLRQDELYKEKEKAANKSNMEKLRQDESYKQREKEKNALLTKNLRQNVEYKEREKQIDSESKRTKREIDLFRYRENLYRNVISSSTPLDKLKLHFIKDRASTPDIVCFCCENIFFKHSVVNYRVEDVINKFDESYYNNIYNTISTYVCRTCLRYISKGLVPKLATSNGLKFPNVPECVRQLSPLEERMVSPYINFMQIRPLKFYALNPQLGLKGSVVNIPIEINDILHILPRNFDNMATIQLKLKRHMLHTSDYMFETIRPAVVLEALKYLLTTPLYKKHDIQIDQKYLLQFENQFEATVDFIIDESDLHDGNKNYEQVEINNDYNENLEIDEDVMILDSNRKINDEIKITAPGQGRKPVPWHLIDDIEELSFPTIFGGFTFGADAKLSYSDRVKSESRRKDRRSCVPTRILYMAKKKLEMSCISSINICLRKSKRTENVSAANVLQTEFLNSLIKFDEGYKILKQVRSSPSYWETKKKDLLAMIRQLGKPNIFMTLSAGEIMWPELIKALYKLKYDKSISVEEAYKLSENEKTLLIKNDPVTCARYFDFKVSKLMILFKQKNSIFGKFCVTDSYNRVEFQMRGSPHEHILLWLKDAPIYDKNNPSTIDNYVSFIDKFISCEYDSNNPYIAVQRHRHTHTCHKGKRNEQKCRFNYPIPVMPRTMILEPLSGSEKNETLKQSLLKIRKLMQHYYMKEQYVSFDDILAYLELSESQYILSLRYPLKRTQVYLKRTSLEVGINCYNKDVLHLFESNMDIQVIVEEYGLASYIINYIAKMESGLSKLLRDASSDIENGNKSIKEKFSKIANVFLNSNMMSAQEASYHVLSLPLSKMSRQCTFINTSPINERVMMLKSNSDLKRLESKSTDIFMDSIFLKYSKRPLTLENICLADFVSIYSKKKSSHEEDINDDDVVEADSVDILYRIRKNPAVIRFRRYKLVQDPTNYYREQLLLFYPWRNELNEIENITCELKYNFHRLIIDENRQKYSILSDEILDEALDNVENELIEIIDEDIQNYIDDKIPRDQEIDIAVQDGTELSNNKNATRFTCPKRISEEVMLNLVKNLNKLQKEFVMHVLKCIKTEIEPFRIFLSGSAGVGKSTVINCLYQLVTHHFDNIPGGNKDKIVVLLCAPSGKAAFVISGVTLHTAFALPVVQFAGCMPELCNDIANNIREKLSNLKLLIIDEISMVGSTLFNRVDTRLRQIMGENTSFGGIPVICVGDLNQLPPVMDTYIFKMPKNNQLNNFFDSNPLWDEFKFFELTQVMRQKDDLQFITALNNLAAAKMTDNDIKLIRSRQVPENMVPEKAIRLFAENYNVDLYNDMKIKKHPGQAYKSIAKDIILGKVSETTRTSVLNSLVKKKVSEVNGLPHIITFKIGIKYMITYNIDVEDGLVNGACGVLELITFKPNTQELSKVWLNFESKSIGNKARLPFSEQMRNENIGSHLTPISKSSITLNISNKLHHQIVRQQFPLVPAEALTIHKSQGQTYSDVCVDCKKSKRITRNMLYVALSRVTKLTGLHIVGNFKNPVLNKKEDPSMVELSNLRNNKQLNLSFNTFKKESGLKVIYLNICSILTKLQYITSDAWYLRGDILIFSETLTKPSDQINIPYFNAVFRSDCKGKSRGLICFCKTSLTVTDIHYLIGIKENCHIEFLTFKILNIIIVTGYKSPSVSQIFFEAELEKIMIKAISTTHEKNIIFMGDFNFNINQSINNLNQYLSKILAKYNLTTRLPIDVSTTNYNTQIDIIFSTFSNIEADVYETFFSYHKAIYAIVKDNIPTHSMEHTKRESINVNPMCNKEIKMPRYTEFELIDNKNVKTKTETILKPQCASTSNRSTKIKHDIEGFEAELIKSDMDIVLSNNGYLEDIHINAFSQIVSSHTTFQLQNPSFLQHPINIKPVRNISDLQILFSIHEGSSIGHWICIHFDGNETIHVYDSLNSRNLNADHVLYIEHLYGTNKKQINFHTVQNQPNQYDCGIFAIAFATSICFNKNPEREEYIVKEMRKHVFEMFDSKLLTPFPTINKTKPETISKPQCASTSNRSTKIKHDLEGFEAELIKSDMDIVLSNNGYLQDIHINAFSQIVSMHTNFQLQNPLFLQHPKNIKPVRNTSDLQILFSIHNNKGSSIGHWICIHFDGNETIHVYDSLNSKKLHKDHVLYIQHLYGRDRKHINFHTVQNQTNQYDCGIFAIAFATSICFNKNPEKEEYIVKHMRKHVAEMFDTKFLTAFPTIN